MFNAPQPRSRLYTSFGAYLKVLHAVVFGFGNNSKALFALEQSLEETAPGYQAIAVPMARVGIYLSLKHLIRPGQKVVLSPYTISEVVNMVLCAGGVPLFSDIEEGGSCNIDAKKVIEILDNEKNIGAVLVTHYYGLICNINPIVNACKAKGIPVLEDAAQAFGASFEGKVAGGLADVGIYSFGMLKTVTSFIGGAVLTKDNELADSIRNELKQWPLIPRKMLFKKLLSAFTLDIATMPLIFDTFVYWLFRYALINNYNFFKNKLNTDSNPIAFWTLPSKYAVRMSNAQAAIIISQLSTYKAESHKRISKAILYNNGLIDIPNIVIPPLRLDGSHIYLYYCIQSENRDDLSHFVTVQLRDIQISHHRNCAALPCFSQFHRHCPNAEKAGNRVIYLPLYPSYDENQVLSNIRAIRDYYLVSVK